MPDPRRRRGQRYRWPVLLTLIAAALVSGQLGGRAIGPWVAEPAEELGPALGLPPGRAPSAATLRRALRAVDPAALEERIAGFVAALPAAPAPPARAGARPAAPPPWTGLALDGKAVRGANRHGAQVHLVSLVRLDDGRVLGQVAVADTGNEVTAAARLLARQDVRGTVTTVDALLAQREPARQLRAGGRALPHGRQGQPAGVAGCHPHAVRRPAPGPRRPTRSTRRRRATRGTAARSFAPWSAARRSTPTSIGRTSARSGAGPASAST